MIGVLALQGGFAAHAQHLNALGAATVEVRLPADLAHCRALVLPGGESTTMLRLMKAFDLIEPLRQFCSRRPVLATCAGAILLAQKVSHPAQESLGLLPVAIERNAYGCQRESFEAVQNIPLWQIQGVPALFIRAPRFLSLEEGGERLQVLSSLDQDVTGVRMDNIIAVTYHPELCPDLSFHRAWLEREVGKPT
jgi:5'-phosphate synthase pdxT subunit